MLSATCRRPHRHDTDMSVREKVSERLSWFLTPYDIVSARVKTLIVVAVARQSRWDCDLCGGLIERLRERTHRVQSKHR